MECVTSPVSRYKIPDPFSEQFKEPKQEKLPGLEAVSEEAVKAAEKIIDKVRNADCLRRNNGPKQFLWLLYSQIQDNLNFHLQILFKFEVSPDDLIVRQQTFEDLCDLVARYVSPLIEPRWFGSSRNGLVLNTSDMDITLDVGKIEPVDATHILSQLAKIVSMGKGTVF